MIPYHGDSRPVTTRFGSLGVSGTGTSPSVFLYSPDADEQGDGNVNTADDNFTIEVYDGNISTAELTFRIFIEHC